MSASKKTRKTEAASPADPHAPSPSKDWRIGADGRVVISRELNDRWIRAIDRMARPILVEGEDPNTRRIPVPGGDAMTIRQLQEKLQERYGLERNTAYQRVKRAIDGGKLPAPPIPLAEALVWVEAQKPSRKSQTVLDDDDLYDIK